LSVSVTHRGTEYPCPLSERFRRHSPEELERLADGIREHGVQNPVILFDNADELGLTSVLDGEGRLTAAAAVGADVPFEHKGYMSLARAYALALALNDARRHDSGQAISRRRHERVELARAKRAKGLSLADIAESLGVSPAQVRRDLDAGGGDPRAKGKAEPAGPADDTPELPLPADAPPPPSPFDELPRFELVQHLGGQLLQLLDSLAQGVGGRHLRKARLPDGTPLFARGAVRGREVLAPPPLVDVLRLVPRTAPAAPCACSGASCRKCRNTGYTPADPAVLATPAVAPGDLASGGDVADVWG
jgi:hypothetical protein